MTTIAATALIDEGLWGRITCPPWCKVQQNPSTHETDVRSDGILVVHHERDFGDYAYGVLLTTLDGTEVGRHVWLDGVEVREYGAASLAEFVGS